MSLYNSIQQPESRRAFLHWTLLGKNISPRSLRQMPKQSHLLELGAVPTSNQSPAKGNWLLRSKKKKKSKWLQFHWDGMSMLSPLLPNYNKNPLGRMHKASNWGLWQVNHSKQIWEGNQILRNNPDGSEFPEFFQSYLPAQTLAQPESRNCKASVHRISSRRNPLFLTRRLAREAPVGWRTSEGNPVFSPLYSSCCAQSKPVGKYNFRLTWPWQQWCLNENTSLWQRERDKGTLFSSKSFTV